MLKRLKEDSVLLLTVDRPDARNAISSALATELEQALTEASNDETLRAVVLRSEGPVFLAGGDLKELQRFGSSDDGPERVLALGRQLGAIEHCRLPVIAAVHGPVYGGGCELLMMCDHVIMEEQASLHFVHAKMGLVPAWGGVTRLLERCGRLGAGEVLFGAEPVSAQRALELGLCNAVVPPGHCHNAARVKAKRIARHARQAIVGLKESIRACSHARRGAAMAKEQPLFRELFRGPAHREVMSKL